MSESHRASETDRAASAATASTAPAAVRVFRRQAIERYLEPPAEATPLPSALPGRFAALWILVAALVAAGLLVAWALAGDLGYLADDGVARTGSAGSALSSPLGEPGG